MNEAMTRAIQDVLAERERQKTVEGWTEAHDDSHKNGEMAEAGACYALSGAFFLRHGAQRVLPTQFWPWDKQWWKPKGPRRDLVRAAALILAEIERLDRVKPEDSHEQ